MDEHVSFGYWLRRRRKALDLTQAELARQVCCALSTIEKLELDARRPSTPMAERLADALTLTPQERPAFLQAARATVGVGVLSVTTEPLEAALGPRPRWQAYTLPTPLTPLIGREQEVGAVRAMLSQSEARLLTLTGPGGSGKTRLAIRAAADLRDHFADGVCFVDLAPIRDPHLVASIIATTVGVREEPGHTLIECLTAYLYARHTLLVLDNFEQVVEAATLMDTLLQAAPRLKILATSRVLLGVYGEHNMPVPPLPVPDRRTTSGPQLRTADVMDCAAVRLFTVRAQAANPNFALTDTNVEAVVEICRRLEGLPLPIELAAARIRLLSPQALLTRLSNRFKLLTGGARDLPARQQTLRGTIDWSYDLLTPAEQTVFRRLAVFVGGWTVEAAEAVCNLNGDVPVEVLDGLQSLCDKSLLRQAEGGEEPRLTMLETIREYAWERLQAAPDAEGVRQAHDRFYLALAEAAEVEFFGPCPISWKARIGAEQANLYAVLQRALDRGDGETALRVCAGAWYYWRGTTAASKGRQWLEAALAVPSAEQPRLRAKALVARGYLALDPMVAQVSFELSKSFARESGDISVYADALRGLGREALGQGDIPGAEAAFGESLALTRDADDCLGVAWSLQNLACVAELRGDGVRARRLAEEGLRLFREVNSASGLAWQLTHLGHILTAQGDDVGAAEHYKESLGIVRSIDDKMNIAVILDGLGRVASRQGRAGQAARLHGAAEALRQTINVQYGSYLDWAEASRAAAGMTDEQWSAAWAEGRAMTLERAIAYALEGTEAP